LARLPFSIVGESAGMRMLMGMVRFQRIGRSVSAANKARTSAIGVVYR
jgi:hypothetical protein